MLIFLKNTIKYGKKIEELKGINFERKPPFCNNIIYTTKIKTLSPYSAKDDNYYSQAYMEECKYERLEEVFHFDNDSDSDSDSDSDIEYYLSIICL